MKTLTRLAALAVLVVFILSIIPAALAENAGPMIPAKEVKEVVKDAMKDKVVLDDKKEKDSDILTPGPGMKEQAPYDKSKQIDGDDKVSDAKEPETSEAVSEVKHPKFDTKEELQKYKEHVKLAKEKYEELKDRRERAKEVYEQQKDELKDRRARMQEICKETPEECTSKVAEFKVGAQEHLLKTQELISASLEKITNRVKDSKVLTEEEKTSALEQIAALEAKLAEEQKKLEALSADTSREEWNAAIREFKLMWTQVKQSEQRIVSTLISSKMGNLVEKHDEFYNSMLMRIDVLKGKGADTASLEEIAADFREQLSELSADQKAAREAWSKATDRVALQQAKDAQQKVRDGMKDTKETLHKFVEEYKVLNKTVQATSAVENSTE